MEVNEPALAYSKRHYTIEEYLKMENAATEKHEYYQGEIFAMSGAKMPHIVVTSNLHFALRLQLKGKPCKPYGNDLRVHIEKNTLFTYPDLTVVCGEPMTLNNDDMNLLNPTVIFEVLSPSTKNYDRGERFRLCRDIPTLQAYILVDSLSVHVESYSIKGIGIWELQEIKDITDTLLIPAIQVQVGLTGLYEGVKLPDA